MNVRSVTSRRALKLGQIIGRGGEGAVYEVTALPSLLAKIYESPDRANRDKLEAMCSFRETSLSAVSAWPVDILEDDNGRTRGFLMPRIASKSDIHEIYSPKSRAVEFPEADFRFLVHVATNIARALAVVHKCGYIVGDINQGSILVGSDGKVVLIDCDSFQVNTNGRMFTCDVGVPLFTPPELHGVQFRGLQRTPNHDAFGLAVILFHILFMGRHPFAGRFLGNGDMPIERAIREFRFAYSSARREAQIESPPGTVPLAVMGVDVSSLFEQAFGKAGVQRRPQATEWVESLDRLSKSLKPCPALACHFFPTGVDRCPWCQIEGSTGMRLFGQRVIVPLGLNTVPVEQLWVAIESVESPGPVPDLFSQSAKCRSPKISVRVRRCAAVFICVAALAGCVVATDSVFISIGGFALAYFIMPRVSAEDKRKHEEARRSWDIALKEWTRRAGDASFRNEREALESVRRELANLPNERTKQMAILEQQREAAQREAYLDRFRIDRGKIPLVGDTRVAMLASFGVETAADIEVNKIRSIPGFGETITRNLLRWRSGHELNFRFNPSVSIDASQIAALERRLYDRKTALIVQLRDGPARLTRLRNEALAERERLRPLITRAFLEKEEAEQRICIS